MNICQEIRQLARRNPGNKYTSPDGDGTATMPCKYTDGCSTDGAVGCIVGQALVNCCTSDVDRLARVDLLSRIDADRNGGRCKSVSADDVLAYLGEGTPLQRQWALRVQNHQDGGRSWGEAVFLADAELQ